MSWTPQPPTGPTYVTVEIPGPLAERFEAACDAIGATQPEGEDRNPEDVIAYLGLIAAERLIKAGDLESIYQGDHDDRP